MAGEELDSYYGKTARRPKKEREAPNTISRLLREIAASIYTYITIVNHSGADWLNLALGSMGTGM